MLNFNIIKFKKGLMALCHLKGEKLIWYEKIHCELKYNLRLAYENFIQMNV